MPEGDLEAVRAQIAVLADRTAVSEVPLRYARGVDRRDWDLVRSCFTADAFVQGSRTTAPLDQYLDILQPAVERYPTTMHFMGNQLVELTGDTARVETYAVAFHFAGDPPGISHPEDLVLGVRYHDTVARRAGSWKITHRQVDADWQRSAPGPEREVRP